MGKYCHKIIHKDSSIVRSKISKAFRFLRKYGFFAKMDFKDCCSCAWLAIPDNIKEVVFYTQQDNEDLIARGSVYISWRSPNPSFIVETLKNEGLTVVWETEQFQSKILVYYKD